MGVVDDSYSNSMKSSRIIFLVFVLLGVINSARAQDYKRQYKTAREFYDNGSYGLAMEAFKPVIVYDKNNPYVEYASFFYALSAYQQRFISVAKDMFIQIKELYPTWNQMDEVNYWMAKIYFDQRQYFQAMQVLKQSPALAVQENVVLMKQHYLNAIEDVETLRMMWEEHPTDEVVGKSLAVAISKQPFLEQDSNLMDSLVTRFGFDRDEFASSLKPINVFKDKYTVALLFPFLANTLEPTTSTKVNQNILDLYLGIKMASDSLRKIGIDIDLRSYDTERSNAATSALLKLNELKDVDLIVGPLFQNQVKLVQEFSINNKINMMSPVSSNSEFVGENPFALLLQPSNETIGKRSAEWIATQVLNKNCMVFYGESQRDTMMVNSFMMKAGELGINIVYSEKVSKENSGGIFKKLADPVEYDEFKNPIEFVLKTDSIGSVYVASDDPLIYTKVISAVDTRGDSIIVVGNETWLNNAAANFQTYERLHLTMAAPTFTSLSNPNYLTFRKRFIAHHGTLPSEFSRIGFEFMWYVGHNLKKHGVYFQEGVAEEAFVPGFLFRGYDFSSAHTNQFVPFIHFENGQLTFLR